MKPGAMRLADEERVCVMEGEWSPSGVIRQVVEEGQEDPFYVMDLGEVVRRYQHWKAMMPRVEPFYAVKCNDDKLLVRALAALGTGFDCASKAEIQLVMDMGIKAERIIFANPAKMASHIRYATARGVTTMTFDSETELHKIKQIAPDARLVIRIRCDAAAAQCPLGVKFGCEPLTEAPRLLKLAAVLKLNVAGVSFHVGSGAGESAVYARGIKMARMLFDLGDTLGLDMRVVDIGGGFAGNTDSDLRDVARVVNAAIEANFDEREVRVIAEPGRYFAAAAYTLATMVHATRQLTNASSESHTMYFINDGVYGSFNCVLYDHQTVVAEPLDASDSRPEPCSVWGPTCDGLDCVIASCHLPALRTGQWLVFKDMGAYTLPVASAFNGFPVPKVKTIVDKRLWAVLKDLWPLNEADVTVDNCPLGPQSPESLTPRSETPSPTLENPHHTVFVECALK
ncbi:ornithine decarboxylase 1 [Pieris rapae]|uniref:ornithine decarboxylase 1 n=1 Tax=Pieris rapae TaxID=64459 RepID=UPI001E280F04|nr:ornithine decarboxylase 1 [Pieris rapae]XP_022125490.2 ornithine decarboxylase 1 [Pieris rapae]XP_022125491.2 ornithine decarboxylase 1 [Pieris rapae]XP_045484135.1 ornithine decarboxylase 1 [Pieris rapae]XP_045484136.1 ornithine decarboxylase 1 [Pieris rapae]